MKIMFICLSLSGGGTERVVANLVNYLSKKNEIKIVKILNKDDDYIINKNIKVYTLDANKSKESLLSRQLKKISIKRITTLKKIILDEGVELKHYLDYIKDYEKIDFSKIRLSKKDLTDNEYQYLNTILEKYKNKELNKNLKETNIVKENDSELEM